MQFCIQNIHHEHTQLNLKSIILKKGIWQLHFQPPSRPDVKWYSTCSFASRIISSPKQRKLVTLWEGGNAYLFSQQQQKKPAPPSHQQMHLRRKCLRVRQVVSSTETLMIMPVPFFRHQAWQCLYTPLHITAGYCSQETEVLKLENRCQRK